MWACIVGAPGTCKNKMADILVEKEGFKLERQSPNLFYSDSDAFFCQLNNLMTLFRFQKDIENRRKEEDILTIRSFWDEYDGRTKALHKLQELDSYSFKNLTLIYNTIYEHLQPPDVFLYTKSDVQHIQSWTSVKEIDGHLVLSDDQIRVFNKCYEDFISRVRTPVVEADMTQIFDEVIADVLYGIETIKSTSLMSQTIWKRKIYR